MGEHKGFLLMLIIFFSLVVPGILMYSIDTFQQNSFMKMTTEVGEVIKEEGGVTEKVAKMVNSMQSNGYVIKVTDSKGNKVSNAVNYGEVLKVDFKYSYLNFFGKKELSTTNTIPILKRNSSGSGDIADGGVIRTITLKSNEFEDNGIRTQTFSIPNLKEIRSITANTGSAEVQDVAGNSVVVRMSNGDPTRQEEIQDGRPEEKKYIDDYDGPYYDDEEGFRGTLEKYLKEGEYVPGGVKFINDWDTEDYADDEGFIGKLQRYQDSGFQLEEDWKSVTQSVVVGEMNSGEIIKTGFATHTEPVLDKNDVVFESNVNYDDGTYKGTLYLKDIDWIKVSQSNEITISYTAYSTDENSVELQSIDYDKIKEKLQQTLEDNNPTIINATWDGNVETGSFYSDGSYYSHKRTATITIKVDGFIGTAHYEGIVKANTGVMLDNPTNSKTATAYATHDEPVWNKNDVVFDSNVFYNQGDYKGLLSLQNIEWKRVPQSKEITISYIAYSSNEESEELQKLDFDTIAQKVKESLSLQDNNPTVKSATWLGNIESGSFTSNGSYYSYKRTATITLLLDGFIGTAHYEGIVRTAVLDIPKTIEYAQDFYYGTLEKDGELIKEMVSGSPANSKTATAYVTHDEPVWNKNDVVFNSNILYSKNEYIGQLSLKNIEWTRIPQSNEITITYTSYSTDEDADVLQELDSNTIVQTAKESLSLQDNNPTIKSATWDGDIESGSFTSDESYYSYRRTATITLLLDGFIGRANYEGTVNKPDTRIYKVSQNYTGIVHRPEIDTRVFKYQGVVEKPTIDTRVYKYRGYVTKPAIPNSGAMQNYYQYTLTVEYEAWE